VKKKVLSWGTFMCDIIAAGLDRVADPGIIEYLEHGIQLRLGGHPVDVTIDLARVGMDQSQIAFVSTIGTDPFGDFLMRELAPYDFHPYVERVEGSTGKVLIISVKGQDRLAHLDPGACVQMSMQHLRDVLDLTEPDVFTLRPGYTNLDLEIAGMLQELRTGPLKKSFVLLDLCAPYKKPWSYYLSLFPYVDAVHGNSKEILRACGANTFAEATDRILSLGTNTILLTKEDAGAEIITRRQRVSQPAFEIQFVEPSGCGDAFCAGVIYALLRTERRIAEMDGNELAKVLLWGQALGAAAATDVGCVAGVSEAKVWQLMESQGDRILIETKG
jgi:sugar/nucleoside kinase (ribokinase family)